jgi:putative flippase GtrA
VELLRKHAQKIRFGIVGLANTALDFILLFLFVGVGLDKIPANYLSTGISFIFSFFVNKKFTFKSTTGNAKKQFAIFLVVTMFGLWVIQPIVIAVVAALLGGTGWNDSLILFIAKVVATGASLVWNYLFYSRLVFKSPQEK